MIRNYFILYLPMMFRHRHIHDLTPHSSKTTSTPIYFVIGQNNILRDIPQNNNLDMSLRNRLLDPIDIILLFLPNPLFGRSPNVIPPMNHHQAKPILRTVSTRLVHEKHQTVASDGAVVFSVPVAVVKDVATHAAWDVGDLVEGAGEEDLAQDGFGFWEEEG